MLEQFTPAGGSLEKQTVTTKNLTDNTLYATKLVFGHPLWGGNLSFGGEYTYTNRNNAYMNVEGILDDNNSNIKENSTSAFLEYARSFGKLQAQLGVRYEHLSSDYYEDGKYMDEQSRTYDNVFPSISLNLPIGKVQTQLTYTGSIYRPSYWMLRSDIMYGNRYTYEGGNPRIDLSGKDVIRKLVILAREAGYKVEKTDVEKHLFIPDEFFEGSIEEFWKNLPQLDADFEARRKQLDAEGKRWRFVATFDHGKLSVALKEVDSTHPFYNLQGSNNIVALTTERYREYPMLIQGYGAGASVTAAGVFANIMSIANI
jgi:hypothetical protein